ncbi:MAG: thiamine-phosphate kinase [Verrucomicrobia bacterium]|nr:thiamine-phosphate kinase [Kiritimatiellia bacterium]MCO6399697.1 thiamine-phosphate kinase [Verrucomicrobiota bacterium]
MRREKTLDAVGERELIRLLMGAPYSDPAVLIGPGDDAAVVRPRPGREVVLKADAIVENVHFLPDSAPFWIGHKAAARVLSDFAAMGATPRHLLVSLAAPGRTPVSRVKGIYKGLRDLCEAFGVSVVGGETVTASELALHIFGAGELPRGRALTRSGAKPGDVVMVTGALGGSIRGKHLRFEPRVREGQWLSAGNWATAAIDVSDGLATDLFHLAEASGVHVDLDAASIPIASAARAMKTPRDPLRRALFDGEDFELIFTVRPRRVESFFHAWRERFDLRVTAIGLIGRGAGPICLHRGGQELVELTNGGYEHFSRNSASTT